MEQDLRGLAAALASGAQSSRALVEQCLDRIAEQNGRLHAFLTVFAKSARAEADRADAAARAGTPLGPLHGIPFAMKDLADIAGHEPSFGSRCYGRGIAERTAPAVARLQAAGAILLGVTHMVEFAIGGWGTNYSMGTPRNPCDPDHHRVPGGSSSGSAVAVAAELVPFAIGSDTGGSVRIPASLCGVVGLKPSSGRIPLDGIAPLSPSFDTLGPLTRTVDDAGLLSDIMAGEPPRQEAPELPHRIGYVPPAYLDPIDADVLAAYLDTIGLCRARGHDLVPVTPPLDALEYQRRNGSIVAHEIFSRLGDLANDQTRPIDPYVRARVLAGAQVDAATHRTLLAERRIAIAQMQDMMAATPLILMPTTPIQARRLEQVDEATIPLSRFTRIANFLDLPAISLPLPGKRLPIGLQVMAAHGSDLALIAAADALATVLAKIKSCSDEDLQATV
ncbi:amidase [Roseicyclus mahoneyensis]|uniref:Aspartyl-tRNA(Asn)/glutamyl-tRNA(Gln) amidotransferase subunit A n=1 Tax=Roseicyclus mahoneyensis TaxID=164332 RepID=A0A316GL50_9RHOB|nr:amidase [Roseicyclus mahoneyensis]PWK55557.1 aspartyl-tRNA(Asn)/glutamyl-tRNA(Gln) amidotransferase subunit A [Roseicyclus mahoneyensis]